MLHFDCDYMRGAHPLIMERLLATNMEQTVGYGCDDYCESARQKIRTECGCEEAEVTFLVGGTQTNATVIDALLRSWQGVLAAETGHINVHESGAIEFGGHKVLALPQHDGKLLAEEIDSYVTRFYADRTCGHMVAPGMVYISYPTEYGTLYSRSELENISSVCRKHSLPLFIDGARLGYGLASYASELTLKDIASLCDVFYIGGTKVGALFGEAVVFTRKNLVDNFFPIVKQHGALLAKGRLLGLQFDTLFTDGLYMKISCHAIDMAMKLKEGFLAKGYELFIDSPTNQQFVILDSESMERLGRVATFEVWEPLADGRTAVRFATDWATREADVDELLRHI